MDYFFQSPDTSAFILICIIFCGILVFFLTFFLFSLAMDWICFKHRLDFIVGIKKHILSSHCFKSIHKITYFDVVVFYIKQNMNIGLRKRDVYRLKQTKQYDNFINDLKLLRRFKDWDDAINAVDALEKLNIKYSLFDN